jgi:hypothetical protein
MNVDAQKRAEIGVIIRAGHFSAYPDQGIVLYSSVSPY